MVAARGGDTAAFEQLVDLYRRPLHAHCYRMLGSLQDAEDALQETLLAAWRGLGGFEGRSSLSGEAQPPSGEAPKVIAPTAPAASAPAPASAPGEPSKTGEPTSAPN